MIQEVLAAVLNGHPPGPLHGSRQNAVTFRFGGHTNDPKLTFVTVATVRGVLGDDRVDRVFRGGCTGFGARGGHVAL